MIQDARAQAIMAPHLELEGMNEEVLVRDQRRRVRPDLPPRSD